MPADEASDYTAEHVGIAVGRRCLTKEGQVIVSGAEVILMHSGDGPVHERMIAVEAAGDAEVVGASALSFGTGYLLRLGDTSGPGPSPPPTPGPSCAGP